MSLSDDGSSLPPPSPSPSPATPPTHKPHCRSKRKKRLSLIDHNNNNLPTFNPKPPNPHSSAPMVTRPCTECGKKFWSWKALFGHMRCHPERQWRGINPPPNLQRPQPQPPPPPPPPELSTMTAEDHEIAAGLLLLANSSSAASMRFECSSCKKVFGSRQALGGHRASHKNVKGCFANEEEDEESTTTTTTTTMMNVLEGHRCGICFRVFPSGQALGGHMRCHWDKGDPPPPEQQQQFQLPLPLPSNSIIPQFHHPGFGLDLNLPPPPPPHDSPAITLDLRLGL